MSEMYFESRSKVEEYLINTLGFTEDDAVDFDMELTDYEEEPYKRSTQCFGYIHDSVKDVYYAVNFMNDYDWGNSDYTLDLEPVKRQEYEETVVVKKVKYIPAE